MTALDSALITRACAELRDGGVVVYPTDTFYGLAADPRRPDAVARLFAVKGRPQGQAIPLIAADAAQAAEAGDLNAAAWRLARAFWPGPLSVVVPARDVICIEARAADGTIAVRVPAGDAAQQLARAFGFCITATSANRSGQPASTSAAAVSIRSLGEGVGLVLDGGDTPGGSPSTLVDVRGLEPRLIRPGAIAWDRVLRSLE
jgi:L-threonylcarbamoyladenylate synthase